MSRKNIKVPESLFLALRDDKDDNQSWPHYLESECLGAGDGDADLAEQLDRIEDAVGRDPNRATPTVELDASEHKRIAEEVAEGLR